MQMRPTAWQTTTYETHIFLFRVGETDRSPTPYSQSRRPRLSIGHGVGISGRAECPREAGDSGVYSVAL